MEEKTEIERLIERITQDEIKIIDLDKRILAIELTNEQSCKDIEELKKYKEIVIELKKDIKTILDQIAEIKEVAAAKSKTTLTLAIAILSPMFTALIAFLMWTWFYKPVHQPTQPAPTKTSYFVEYIFKIG